MFADPFTSAGLIIDPSMHEGYTFEVLDVKENRTITLACPEEMYDLLAFIGTISRFMIKAVYRKKDGEIAAVASTQRLSLIAGKDVGKDDPVLVIRCQSGLPAVGEVLEPFTFPHMVEGFMRGSHQGPLMPVPSDQSNPSRFDGSLRVIAAGFQLNEGRLIGPRDMFDDPSFDHTRQKADEISDYIRHHGPFEPHRVPSDEMEYTTMPQIMEKLKDRFKPLD